MEQEIKELKEKIIVLQNFHKVKDKKLKLFEEERERHNKLIAKQKERINRARSKLQSMFDNGNEETILDDLLELDKILEGSDNEWPRESK